MFSRTDAHDDLLERRYFTADFSELRVLDAESGPQIVWYPAVFNSLSEDLGGFRELVDRRAFNKALRDSDVRALFNHDPNFVLGRNISETLSLSITDKGLRAVVNPPDVAWARDLLVSIRRGDISGGSFAFSVQKDEWRADETGQLVRTLLEVGPIYDASIVTYPAYPGTNGTISARALETAKQYADAATSRPAAEEIERQHAARTRRLRLLEPVGGW